MSHLKIASPVPKHLGGVDEKAPDGVQFGRGVTGQQLVHPQTERTEVRRAHGRCGVAVMQRDPPAISLVSNAVHVTCTFHTVDDSGRGAGGQPELLPESARRKWHADLIGLHHGKQSVQVGWMHVMAVRERLPEALGLNRMLPQQPNQIIAHFGVPHCGRLTQPVIFSDP
jgi:hypothetical protein